MSSNTTQEVEKRIIDPDPDRERGVLTPHDRAFLRAAPGEGVREEMSDTAIRQKRHKIRQRFRNALIDIQYLLLLEGVDLSQLFPSDEWDEYERGIVYGAVFAAVYHMMRAEDGREPIIENFEDMVANDVIREYAEDHGVFAPVEVNVEIDVPPLDECPALEDLLSYYRAEDEELPYKAHMALDYAGVHPHPDEY